jgi:hypothetical protein
MYPQNNRFGFTENSYTFVVWNFSNKQLVLVNGGLVFAPILKVLNSIT